LHHGIAATLEGGANEGATEASAPINKIGALAELWLRDSPLPFAANGAVRDR
jgi:hypothetical protein